MEIRPHVATVVGNITETRWGQVLQTPFAYAVVEVHTKEANARHAGVEILTKTSRLLDGLHKNLGDLEHIADSIMSDEVAGLVLLVPYQETLYIVSRGQTSVYIRRNNQLARLVANNQALSGAIKDGDTIIAASASFVSALKERDILAVFDHADPDGVAERLTLVLHEHAQGVGGAALIFRVDALVDNNTRVHPQQEQEVIEVQADATKKKLTLLPVVLLFKNIFFCKRLSKTQLISVFVMGLFLVSVFLGIHKQQQAKKNSTMTQVLLEAQHSYDEGIALADLNPVKSRERFSFAKEQLTQYVVEKPKTQEEQQIKTLYEQITDAYTRSLRITNVDLQVFFDVSLLKSAAVISDASFFDDSFGLLDEGGKTVYLLDAETKNGQIIGGGEAFSSAQQVAIGSEAVYVLTQKGVQAISLSSKKTEAGVIEVDAEWGTIHDMVVFGGNLYLLDTGKSRIWKYVATEKSFTDRREYLNPDYFPDLSKAIHMVIDGSVWIGSSDGVVQRFSQGTENSYLPQGAEPPLGKTLSVFAGDDEAFVYFLDHDNNRVLVFDKDGFYISQYVWSNTIAASQIFVSEALEKIFLLADGKLYSIDLQ